MTLAERGLDFAEAELVFEGRTTTLPDERRNYGEPRFITAGWLRDRFVVVVWTPRDGGRRIISMSTGMPTKKNPIESRWVDPDDAPHLDREWFESAEIREGDRLVCPARVVGQSKKETEKEAVSIPIDADVLAYFRATGPGWQSQINAACAGRRGCRLSGAPFG
jgi:uncharacterized protein